jgi:hypothetical protein
VFLLYIEKFLHLTLNGEAVRVLRVRSYRIYDYVIVKVWYVVRPDRLFSISFYLFLSNMGIHH